MLSQVSSRPESRATTVGENELVVFDGVSVFEGHAVLLRVDRRDADAFAACGVVRDRELGGEGVGVVVRNASLVERSGEVLSVLVRLEGDEGRRVAWVSRRLPWSSFSNWRVRFPPKWPPTMTRSYFLRPAGETSDWWVTACKIFWKVDLLPFPIVIISN